MNKVGYWIFTFVALGACSHLPKSSDPLLTADRSLVSISSIPKRLADAPSGSQFLAQTANLSQTAREAAILGQLRRGNLPDHLRRLTPVKIHLGKRTAVVWTMTDYLGIGSRDDFIRIPMNPQTAQEVADHFGMLLPTPKLVDEIYSAAPNKVKPQPLPPGPRMVSNDYYRQHDAKVKQQLNSRNLEKVTAGHKKDVVLTNKLYRRQGRVAIYGWHRLNGKPIQPVSTVHGDHYADYSHGVRLIYNMMLVDGVPVPTAEVMTDKKLSAFVSGEGPLKNYRYKTVK